MNAHQANHFDLARFIAALLVMASHAFALTASGAHTEPLVYLSGHRTDLGAVGVAAFFIISGYLIAGSWDRSLHLWQFLRARILRIMPGLAVALLFCAVVGIALTVSPGRYTESAISFVFRNLLLFHGQPELAGVFVNNPYGEVVNGSLWTLRYEFTCYLLVAGLGMMRQLRGGMLLLIWGLCCVAWKSNLPEWLTVGQEALLEFLPLLGWFMAGACVYTWRRVAISPGLWPVLIGGVLFVLVSGSNLLLTAPLIALALIRLLLLQGPMTGFGRYGDFSYGLYIYAFPVQQWLVSLMPEQTPWLNFLMALPLTLVLAVLSWCLVERHFLRLKRRRPGTPVHAEFIPMKPPVQ